ncbi:TetR/AcrR family transcriptional regulator [Proteiniphilum sp. UBA5384]|uniref:TetR/AcrR family transcriptional regulator n=1 Tax=Proteiniphilum sp. UBA5384 TaxID=1947279 RepID=UPI0025F988AC|nr:TetR/AcrR family transcriptional regulator [Proteiniphilum sp. UBA5384]
MKEDDKSMEFQILEAAENLFLKQGYAKTSTGQIAKLAGCNQALVHYYYRTKDNLFEKVFEEKIGMIASNILSTGENISNIEERIAQLVSFHFNFLKQNPMLPQFVLNEISSNPDRLQSLVDRLKVHMIPVLTQLEAELEKEIEKGTIRPILATDLLITILSLNIMPFLVKPVLQRAFSIPDGNFEEMLEQRQKEVIETVLSRLRV